MILGKNRPEATMALPARAVWQWGYGMTGTVTVTTATEIGPLRGRTRADPYDGSDGRQIVQQAAADATIWQT